MDAFFVMAKRTGINIRDSLSPELNKLAKKVKNLSKPMGQVEREVMSPLRKKAWGNSGINVETGEIRKSVKTFSGKKSAGVNLKARGLTAARAVLLSNGAKKRQYRRKNKTFVRSHTRKRHTVKAYFRRNLGSPWGKIKARPFVPTRLSGSDRRKILKIVSEYVQTE